MSSRSALVSVGVPTFNSERYVRLALESIAAQHHSDLEIIISDDGSTDRTLEICEEFARTDSRVTVMRHPHMGERHNFNVLLAYAQGEFFMWAADHDIWHPEYVSRCVDALRASPQAILAYAHSMMIDADGTAISPIDDELPVTSARALDRYLGLIWSLTFCSAIFGVTRRKALITTGGYGPTPSPDHLVLAELALRGTFIQLPEVMYWRRQNRPPETDEQQRARQAADLDPALTSTWLAMQPRDYFRSLRDGHIKAVIDSEMPLVDKGRAILGTLACFESRFAVSSRSSAVVSAVARVLPPAGRTRITGQP